MPRLTSYIQPILKQTQFQYTIKKAQHNHNIQVQNTHIHITDNLQCSNHTEALILDGSRTYKQQFHRCDGSHGGAQVLVTAVCRPADSVQFYSQSRGSRLCWAVSSWHLTRLFNPLPARSCHTLPPTEAALSNSWWESHSTHPRPVLSCLAGQLSFCKIGKTVENRPKPRRGLSFQTFY